MFDTVRQRIQHRTACMQVFPPPARPVTVTPSASVPADERERTRALAQDAGLDVIDDLPRAAIASLAAWAQGRQGAGRLASRLHDLGRAQGDPDVSERRNWRAAALR